ncbi:MAG TPA: autotransporter outer membrane beta-barrel domain-containing protein [Luteibacter sp.]|nr:autotransporter outer membrane beta-barrel domain-containing protein [Luteibacter sp.]
MKTKKNSPKQRPLAAALHCAFWSAALLPTFAMAQTVPGGNTSPLNYTNTGSTPPDQTVVNVPGTPGGDGAAYTIDLQPVQDVRGSSLQTLFNVSSTGGNGGASGQADVGNDANGPSGGAGGAGGALAFTVDAPSPNASAIENYANGGYAVSLSSQGGNAGAGQQAALNGNGGIGGTGGVGGTLVFNLSGNASYPDSLNFIEATGAAVNLSTSGGRGGDSGESQESIAGPNVTGRKGGTGGDGGEIDANLNGELSGYNGGSGIIAVSTGGGGGTGGDAEQQTGKATGSDGGDAGNGGVININLTGGNATAAGPGMAATGPLESFDSLTDPTQTVPLATSITVGAILATSQGGLGGLAGNVDGAATKGGNGAAGGTGGVVTINLGGAGLPSSSDNAVLSTTGYNTVGAMALSAGGNGGNGNSGSGVYFRAGGAGGTGGDGGSAFINVANDTSTPYAKILTAGNDADALVAMSVGGGGGYSGDLNDSSGGGIFSVYIGGQGGNGGDGGNAKINNGFYDAQGFFHPGDVIATTGTYARGMVAESVGGGGGRGGDATNTALGSAVTIGGSGGSGGVGGLAQAFNDGLIDTSGQHSSGIFSQSVGGGGGAGGGALSRAIGAQITVSIAVGGSGGKGGVATEADAYNIGQVQTSGGNADGIFAQAVGGGGGLGGTAAAQNYNTSIPDEPSVSLTASVGGKGGSGGNGGLINVMNSGLLQTQGQDAYGVFAQSVGGGGGAGGDATATSMAYQQAKLAVTTSVGGSGGAGGNGGQVNVWNSGLITTAADKGIGVFAQSVGGGGGTGGFGTTDQGGLYSAGNYSVQLSVAVGGQGGAAGQGGNVLVNNYISPDSTDPGYFSNPSVLQDQDIAGAGGILTVGDLAAGIFAQSVGGGGGNGGDSTGKGSNGQVNVNVAVGGGGGAGGEGGNVTVHNGIGAIKTLGAQSYGVMAQSVGGGGGTGGNAATGSGDDPEYLYPKLVTNLIANGYGKNPSAFTQVTDNLWDWKDNVKGAWDDKNTLEDLYNATMDANGVVTKPWYSGLTGSNLTIDVGGGAGGKGGAGGDGGIVSIDSYGSIITTGPMAYGMFGQSVGGGGGVGGGSAPVTSNDKLHDSLIESSISVGGTGGKGGNGGVVTITNDAGGDIETSGDLSYGMLSQSVGGGGGVGGASTPNAGLGNPMALSFGASSSDGIYTVSGHGGTATAINSGAIQTTGDNAIGMVVQSIGGGGGVVSVMGQSADTNTGLYHSSSQTLAQGTVTPTLAQNDASTKNVGGNATAQLNSGGSVSTLGVNAMGVLAQSIGGGGGLMVIDPNNQVTVDQLAPDPDNNAPSGGNGAGAVNVTTQGQATITTQGNGAAGIVAQSLGGGGALVNGLNGVNLSNGSSKVYEDRWDMGMGGTVTVNNSADITTTGAYAHGIFAQVASGTGGVIGRSDGTGTVFRSGKGDTMYCGGDTKTTCGGAVAVNLQGGTITVSGQHSWGVAMESENVSYQTPQQEPDIDESTATLTVSSNAVISAQGAADGAVLLNASGTNTVTNAGVIEAAGSDAYAISSVGKSFTVINQGGATVIGSIGSKCSGDCGDVAPLHSSIQNQGTIDTGNVMDLGGGELSNAGVVSIHGNGAGTTTLTGNYSGAGQLVFDADYAHARADNLVVSGTADVASVAVRPTTMRNQTVPLMTATGGLTVDPQLTAANTSLLFSTRLDHDANTLYATPEAHLSDMASGMGATSRAVADHLQNRFDAGIPMDDGFTALSKVASPTAYATALNSMNGRALGSIGAFRFQSSRDFVGNLNQGCAAGSSQDDCTWGRVQANGASQGETSDGLGYRANTQTYEMGVQHELGDGLTLGGGVGYENNAFRDADGLATVKGGGALAGIGLRYDHGPFEVSGILDGGYGSYDSNRTVVVGSRIDQAKANPEVWNAGVNFQASYTYDMGHNSYLKPFAELRGIEVRGNGYTEHGNSPFNLAVATQSQFSVGAGLGSEFGTKWTLGNGAQLGLHLSGALESAGGTDWVTRTRFADESAGSMFEVHTNVPNTYGRVGLGVDMLNWKNLDFSLDYTTEFGSGYHADTGTARVAWHF